MTTAPIELVVNKIIGTGDPMDALLMIPLIHQWGIRRACATETADPCEAPIARIVCLSPPGLIDDTGFADRTPGYCEEHYRSFMSKVDGATCPACGATSRPDLGNPPCPEPWHR